MARAHFVKKARKTIRGTGIKKGDSYWWWKFRYGEKQVSKTQPKDSQLTQSEFLGSIYAAQESLADPGDTLDEIRSTVETVLDDLNSLRDETDDKFNNMPESLQQGDTGQLLEDRVQNVEQMIDDLEAVDITAENEDEVGNIQEELSCVSYGGD